MPFLLALCVIFMPFIVLTFNSHQMHCIAVPISVRHIVSFHCSMLHHVTVINIYKTQDNMHGHHCNVSHMNELLLR